MKRYAGKASRATKKFPRPAGQAAVVQRDPAWYGNPKLHARAAKKGIARKKEAKENASAKATQGWLTRNQEEVQKLASKKRPSKKDLERLKELRKKIRDQKAALSRKRPVSAKKKAAKKATAKKSAKKKAVKKRARPEVRRLPAKKKAAKKKAAKKKTAKQLAAEKKALRNAARRAARLKAKLEREEAERILRAKQVEAAARREERARQKEEVARLRREQEQARIAEEETALQERLTQERKERERVEQQKREQRRLEVEAENARAEAERRAAAAEKARIAAMEEEIERLRLFEQTELRRRERATVQAIAMLDELKLIYGGRIPPEAEMIRISQEVDLLVREIYNIFHGSPTIFAA